MTLNALQSLAPVAAASAASSKSMAVASKSLRQAKAEGQAAVDLISAAGKVGPDGRGRRIHVVA